MQISTLNKKASIWLLTIWPQKCTSEHQGLLAWVQISALIRKPVAHLLQTDSNTTLSDLNTVFFSDLSQTKRVVVATLKCFLAKQNAKGRSRDFCCCLQGDKSLLLAISVGQASQRRLPIGQVFPQSFGISGYHLLLKLPLQLSATSGRAVALDWVFLDRILSASLSKEVQKVQKF